MRLPMQSEKNSLIFDDNFVSNSLKSILGDRFSDKYLSVLILKLAPNGNCQVSLLNLRQLGLYMEKNIPTSLELVTFINLIISLNTAFPIDKVCKIIFALEEAGVDSKLMLAKKFNVNLEFTIELLKDFSSQLGSSEDQKFNDFLQLALRGYLKKVDYLQLRLSKSHRDTELMLLESKFNFLIASFAKSKIYSSRQLNSLKDFYNTSYRSGVAFKHDLIKSLVALSESNLINNNEFLEDRDEYLACFVCYVKDKWVEPHVAVNAMIELDRLGIISSSFNLSNFLLPLKNNHASSLTPTVQDRAILFSYWFTTPQLVALWKKVDSSLFTMGDFLYLLDTSKNTFDSGGPYTTKIIEQLVIDKLNSIILNSKVKQFKSLQDFNQAIPAEVRNIYTPESTIAHFNVSSIFDFLFRLPKNVIGLMIKYENHSSAFTVSGYLDSIISQVHELIENDNGTADAIFKSQPFSFDFEFSIHKLLTSLEKSSSGVCFFACGLLLLNACEPNPRNLSDKNWEQYWEKRLHDAITYLNRASATRELRTYVAGVKTCIFTHFETNSDVRSRLRHELYPRVSKRVLEISEDDSAQGLRA